MRQSVNNSPRLRGIAAPPYKYGPRRVFLGTIPTTGFGRRLLAAPRVESSVVLLVYSIAVTIAKSTTVVSSIFSTRFGRALPHHS